MLWIILVYLIIFILPPLILALSIWTMMALVGWPRRRLLLSAPILLLIAFGGEAWLIHWLRTPSSPDLTREQAAEILRLRPEFQSQGHSPSFALVRRSADSSMKDYWYQGTFSFVKENGEHVNQAYADFQFPNGRWTFHSCHWGPSSMTTYMFIGSTVPQILGPPLPPKNVESPFLPGVSWKRLPDGTYEQQKP